MFQFMVIGPHVVTGHHLKEFGTIFLGPTFEIFLRIGEIHSSLLQIEQAQLPQSHKRDAPETVWFVVVFF